jgi:glycosyltransferase involved in cell wall biosynthesis
MHCPSLQELPKPPSGQTGWPWTQGSDSLPSEMPNGRAWPCITVVTPSFRQADFLEATLRSILLQGYPNLEYFVLDGGSRDGSVEIIKKYERWLTYWVSERDGGQSAAINRGLRMGTGSHATFINSDDMLCRNALKTHVTTYDLAEDVIDVGDCVNIDAAGNFLFTHRGRIESIEQLLRVRSVWQAEQRYISQQEVLFPLPLALSVGALNEDNHYSMDYELWGRLLLAGAKVRYTGIPFGMFRRHEAQKTQAICAQTLSTLDAAEALLEMAIDLDLQTKREILNDLRRYRHEFPQLAWRDTGRLARLGLPRSIVNGIRHLKWSGTIVGGLTRSAK